MENYYTGIGSRETPQEICDVFEEIGYKLAKYYILRSGHADGADLSFEKGYDKALKTSNSNNINDIKGKNIFIPWEGFNNSTSCRFFITNDAYQLAKKFYWNPELFDNLKPAVKKLMARNCYQVLGPKLNEPSNFIICYTENGEMKGGISQALRIAKAYKIPVFNFGCNNNDINKNYSILQEYLKQFYIDI